MQAAFSLIFGVVMSANVVALESHQAFVGGLRAFEAGDYETAAALMKIALESEPACARCAHVQGKSYGRMAERAGWGDAIGLAKKTRLALEQAVELDPYDTDAIRDLIEYYRKAPGFLGGSKRKAEALEKRLQRFGVDQTS